MIFSQVLDDNSESNSSLQRNCIRELEHFFSKEHVKDLTIKNYYFLGVRGNYDNKENYCLNFKFKYFKHDVELYVAYDQLEYYISYKSKVVAECNLEDFWDADILLKKFADYLEKDLLKLNIRN